MFQQFPKRYMIIVCPHKVEMIQSIPLSRGYHGDELGWGVEFMGLFINHTSYKVIHADKQFIHSNHVANLKAI